MKSMDVLKEKLARHPRREIVGRSFAGTPCLELMTLDGERPVRLLPDGYAQVWDGQGGLVRVHRAALAVETGRDVWTEPLECDHRCHTRNCCNPLHLEWTTQAVNSSAERTTLEGLAAKRANGRSAGRIYGRAAAESGLLAANVAAQRIAVISKHLDSQELRYHRDQLAAARELGLHVGSVSLVVRGKRPHTGRYAFVRFDPENPSHVDLHAATEKEVKS